MSNILAIYIFVQGMIAGFALGLGYMAIAALYSFSVRRK